MSDQQTYSWAFFGSSHFSVIVLNELEKLGLVPGLVVTVPEKPRGRGRKSDSEIESSEVRAWAEARNIPVIAPVSLNETKNPIAYTEAVEAIRASARNSAQNSAQNLAQTGVWDVFLIASYGKIVPQKILDLPKRGTLNIHPSLLPKLRGPSPIESAILTENETGVTIMQVDDQVDHGPIVSQKNVVIPTSLTDASENSASNWPPYYRDLENLLATAGARLFAETLPDWMNGRTLPQEQNHAAATFTKKFTKEDGRLEIDQKTGTSDSAYALTNLRKIRAFADSRGAFFMMNYNGKEVRVIVTAARMSELKDSPNSAPELIIERVKPEGKKEMGYQDFLRGMRSS